MIYIGQQNSNRAFLTTLSNATIEKLKAEQNLPIKQFRSDEGEWQHWVAEPSALTALCQYAQKHNQLFRRIEMV